MTRRYLLYVEATSEKEAEQMLNALLSLPRPVSLPGGPVSIGMVDVTDQIVPPSPDVQASSEVAISSS